MNVAGFNEFETLAVRSGQQRTAENEHNDPVFLTSSFIFESAAQAAARFADKEPGNVYSRFTNPTVRTFEQRLAALEGGATAFATASGMAAITTTMLVLLEAGDEVLAARSLFGSTVSLLSKILPRYGIKVTFVDASDPERWEQAVGDNTRMFFLETPTNPLGEVADLDRLADIAHKHGARLVVDNCFLTGAQQQPISHGADVVIHSATKYLDGQGRCVGGAIVLADVSLESDFYNFIRTAGPSMSPFNAWVFLNGLETLKLRLDAHTHSAGQFARWLKKQSVVATVHYAGLPGHPHHQKARAQQSGFGGIVAFEVYGGRKAAWRVIDHLKLASITANFGDAKSTVTHPASTTHGRLSEAERVSMGIREGLIRVSVGLENVTDIIADFEQALGSLNETRFRMVN